MLSQPDRFDLFATRIWVFRLDGLAQHFGRWIDDIARWRAGEAGLGSSNRSGWTSSKTVLELPGFAELANAAALCFDSVWTEIEPVPVCEYKLRAWVNLQEPGGFNHFHMHGRAALAGVFYLDVPDGGGDLIFRDPRAGINLGGIKGNGANCFSVTSHSPASGELVIFPGWLEHGVEVNGGDRPRISVAINCYCDQTGRE